ncbi:MAG: oligosaccharide flippase family protein [Snowella sp.]|nr:oligosaccharide flippase family protein [Snowella sp.]
MLSRYSVYLVNLLSMAVLARLFTPKQFGVIGAVSIVSTFLQMFVESGLGPAIINQKELSDEDRNGIFTLTLILGSCASLLLLLLANPIESFYRIEDVSLVTRYAAFSALPSGALIYVTATLNRDQHFFRIAQAGVIAEVSSLTIVVSLFQFVSPLHALASRIVAMPTINFLILYFFSKETEFGQPKLGTKFSAVKPLLSFSLFQFGFNFINFFSRNLDNILVGRYLGAVSLGIYGKAYVLMRYPLMLLTFAMGPAIQPVMRKYSDNPEKAEKIHSNFIFKLSFIGIFVGLIVIIFRNWIVLVLLGNQWKEVIPLVSILALSIPIQVVLSTSGFFFQAMNRTDILFISGFLSAIIMITAIVNGIIIQRNMILLSWNLLLAFSINFFQTYYFLYKFCFHKSVFSLYRRILPAMIFQGIIILFFSQLA